MSSCGQNPIGSTDKSSDHRSVKSPLSHGASSSTALHVVESPSSPISAPPAATIRRLEALFTNRHGSKNAASLAVNGSTPLGSIPPPPPLLAASAIGQKNSNRSNSSMSSRCVVAANSYHTKASKNWTRRQQLRDRVSRSRCRLPADSKASVTARRSPVAPTMYGCASAAAQRSQKGTAAMPGTPPRSTVSHRPLFVRCAAQCSRLQRPQRPPDPFAAVVVVALDAMLVLVPALVPLVVGGVHVTVKGGVIIG